MTAATPFAEGRFTPAAPFEFAHVIARIAAESPSPEQHVSDPYRFFQAVALEETPYVAEVWNRGKVESPLLQYRFYAGSPVADGVADRLLHWLRFYLSADDALQPLYDLAWDDPPFAALVERLYGVHQLKFPTPFAAAVWAILSQRSAWSSARDMRARLRQALGPTLTVERRSYTPLPAAALVAARSAAELRAIVGDSRKADYLLAAATAFANVDPAFLELSADKPLRKWLENIHGIGSWSATLILVRGLGRMQALQPPFERRLLNAARAVYQAELDEAALLQLAARYGAMRGYWAHYLRLSSTS